MDDPALAALLEGYRVVLTVPVWWGDQDAFGHVNNTTYFRWFESSRIAYCSRVGLGHPPGMKGVGPILAAASCNYRRQLTFPDTVLVGGRVSRIGRSSLTLDHVVVSTSLRAVAADGTSTVVAYDYSDGRPVPVPDAVRAAIAALEGREF